MLRPVLAAAALLALASCTTLTEEECRAGDWFGIGVSDGAEGRPVGRLEGHRRACADVGVIPDAEAWLRGRERGLRQYCVPARAYDVGRRGLPIAEGCTAAERAAMSPAYDTGRQWFRLEEQIDSARDDIRAIERDLVRLPPDSPSRGLLMLRRSMAFNQIQLLRLRQQRYDSWP